MPRSAGVYTLPAVYEAEPNTTIRSEQHNTPLLDIADALTGSLPRDGQAAMTGNLPMGSNRITGLADAVAGTDVPNWTQTRNASNLNAGTVADARLPTDIVRTTRTLTASTGLTGGGTLAADRSFALTGQALALHNLGTSGMIARTGSGTVAGRTIAGGTGISVSNGNGVSGNPTITLDGHSGALITSGTLADARNASTLMRTSWTLTAGTGLIGGGSGAANRSVAVDSTVIRTTGNQTLGGTKTFSSQLGGSNIVGATQLRSTSAEEDWVGEMYSGLGYNDVGSTVLAERTSDAAIGPGSTIAGSSLNPSSAGGGTASGTMSGTWMCCGRLPGDGTLAYRTTVFKRVA